MKILAFAVGFFLIAGCALAGDFDGKWSGPYTPQMGDPMTLTFTFKTSDKTVTGTAVSSLDSSKENPIKDGKIDGKNISFAYDTEYNQMQLKFKYKGVLSGDEIKLTFEMDMGGGGMGGPGAGGPGAGGAPKQEVTVKKVTTSTTPPKK
jgi:hypothetical protein